MTKKESLHSTNRRALPAIGLFFLVALLCAAAYFSLPIVFSVSYSERAATSTSTSQTAQAVAAAQAIHIKTPVPLRAIYMSQCVVGTLSFRNSLITFIDESDLNAVVIDIRDYTGKISFTTDNPMLKDSVSSACGARDMEEFIKTLHEKNIYVIGRITTFQNPYYTSVHPEEAVQKKGGGVWKDYKGLAFVDVGSKPYWDNVVALGKDAYAIGFDELNFDYLRFPSDGPMSEAVYSFDAGKSKAEALEEFFKYLHDGLAPTGVVMSADFFGYVTVHTDDLGIGQVLESALPYFDYIDPMVYPSHYNSGFAGLKDVNSDPYKIVYTSLAGAVARATATTTVVDALGETPVASTSPQLYEKPQFVASKIRPWLQGFDYPVVYTPVMVEAQIRATNDAGLDSYLVWDASNKYTALRQVLGKTITVQ